MSPFSSLPTDLDPPDPKPGRVLVVDDERPVREMFRRSLSLAGFEVVVASDGAEGLEILRTDPGICLVLLDLNMPKVDGRKFRERQRGDPRLAAIPTVVVTGSALSTVVHEELLATDYLLKPVGREHLVSVVSRYCLRRS